MSKLDRHFIEKVKTGLAYCSGSDICAGDVCPYHDTHSVVVCRNALDRDAFILVNEYQHEIGELKENNARLAEQNKKLLEKEIENARLRNENQTIRDDNKYLDTRNDKLCAENGRLSDELEHTREELAMYKEAMKFTEVVKIEDINFAKVAKNADKATKACNDLVDALDKLDELRKRHSVISKNDIRSMFGLPPFNPKPQEVAKEGDVLCMNRKYGGVYYREVQYVNVDGIYDRIGCVRPRCIVGIYRKDENGNLKLIWARE